MGQQATRRRVIQQFILGGAAAIAALLASFIYNPGPEAKYTKKGNSNHPVCRSTYSDLPPDQLCMTVKNPGSAAIDFVGPAAWHVLKNQGVFASMCNGSEISLTEGINARKCHTTLIKNYKDGIELVAKAGYRNPICFSGNSSGMDDETGLKNCVERLKQLMPLAESRNVVLQMELFNSKIDHKDYMCDNTAWGIELCKRIGSPNFKLLYDIYHMQTSEGDLSRAIHGPHSYLGAYHAVAVPGGHEIHSTPKLYHPAVLKAILATDFKGFVASEFVPLGVNTSAKIRALKKAINTFDV